MRATQLWTTIPPLALSAALTLAVPAVAEPAAGVDVQTLSSNAVDGTEYTVVRITVAPEAGTGWHYHSGEVFGLIREGTLTHYDDGCVIDGVFNTGSAVTEGVGPGYVHNGRNAGSTPLVMDVTYVNPVGAPLSVPAPAPAGCPVS